MKKADIIARIRQLKMVKPDKEWLVSSKRVLMAQIDKIEPKSAKAPVFVFSLGYKLAAGLCAVILLLSGAVNLAQTASIDSPLYGAKILMNKAIIALAPSQYKLDLKMAITQMMVNDLNKKVGDYYNQLAFETLTQNLEDITQQLKQISHPQQLAVLSEQLQKETNKAKETLKQVVVNKKEVASEIEKIQNQLEKVENQVFALKSEAEDKINRCPIYLENDLAQLKEIVDYLSLDNNDKEGIISQLKQADELLNSNRCVDALVIIDELKKELGL